MARAAEHAKSRGDLRTAAGIYEEMVARDPGQIPTSTALSGIYLSQRRFAGAAPLLETLSPLWARDPVLPQRPGESYQILGKNDEAPRQPEKGLPIGGAGRSPVRI